MGKMMVVKLHEIFTYFLLKINLISFIQGTPHYTVDEAAKHDIKKLYSNSCRLAES
jgi:hypothetical protein